MEKPIVNEVFCDNGDHSHWNLIDVETGVNLWSEDPSEDNARGFLVKKVNKEFILCAAIWVNDGNIHESQPINIETGFVICGRRHHNCYQTIKSLTNQTPNEKIGDIINSMSVEDHRKHQGFITSLDRYVDRKEGWKIAIANNQVQFGKDCSENGDDSILISENLY